MHLNIIALFVALLGSYRQKIAYDLIVRCQYAFPLSAITDYALQAGIKCLTVIEFGVASGEGLMNMQKICQALSRRTGMQYKIYGFDTGKGMPKPIDHRDHPCTYAENDYKMDYEAVHSKLAPNVTLIIGDVRETVQAFEKKLNPKEPIGFVSVDLDYYSSTCDALNLFSFDDPTYYLPSVYVYFDDIALSYHNSYQGELLAINEFNSRMHLRKIEYHRFFPNRRIFKNALWVKQMFYFHVFDHPTRFRVQHSTKQRIIKNEYL